jgi:hypothetical protein
MSYRELGVFVRHLPQDSWTQTIIRDEQLDELVNPEPEQEPAEPKFGPWALLNYQLATLTDAVNQNTYMVMLAGGLKYEGKDPVPPQPTPRPGLKRGRRAADQPAGRRRLPRQAARREGLVSRASRRRPRRGAATTVAHFLACGELRFGVRLDYDVAAVVGVAGAVEHAVIVVVLVLVVQVVLQIRGVPSASGENQGSGQ